MFSPLDPIPIRVAASRIAVPGVVLDMRPLPGQTEHAREGRRNRMQLNSRAGT